MDAAPPLTLAQVNGLSLFEFIPALAPLYGNGAWVLPLAFAQRPFLSLDHLHRAIVEIVASADPGAQKALIEEQPDYLYHPERAPGAERRAVEALTGEERKGLFKAQLEYEKKFGFPLVLSLAAAREADLDPVAAAAARLANPLDQELGHALDEVTRLARYRLDELVAA